MFAVPRLAIAFEPLIGPTSLIRKTPPRRSVSPAAARGQALFAKDSSPPRPTAAHPNRQDSSIWDRRCAV